MNKQQDNPVIDRPAEQSESRDAVPSASPAKRRFVEPAVSVPVDVLESTAFFQSPTVDTSDA